MKLPLPMMPMEIKQVKPIHLAILTAKPIVPGESSTVLRIRVAIATHMNTMAMAVKQKKQSRMARMWNGHTMAREMY